MLSKSTKPLPHICICCTFPPDPDPNPLEFTCEVELGKALCNSRVVRTHFSSSVCTSYSPTQGNQAKDFALTEVGIQLELVTLAHFQEAPALLEKGG